MTDKIDTYITPLLLSTLLGWHAFAAVSIGLIAILIWHVGVWTYRTVRGVR